MINPGRFQPLIHLAVAEQATRRPDAAALICGDRTISYGMLDAAANYYASELADRGVGSGHIVPLLLDRSADLIALQLGILKTGAAYANLDPRWPLERQTAILNLVTPALVVATRDSGVDRFAVYQVPDGGLTATARHERQFCPASIPPDAPATVFFTSGTTGVPKGVVSPHQAVMRLFGPDGLSGFGPGHAMPQVAPLPWDVYAFEVWGQLTTGGTVILITADYLLPNALRQVVATHGVDTLWLTSSLFNVFVDEDLDSFSGLTHVLTGGEKLSPEHVRLFLLRHPDISLWNGYGPAESCILTTTRLLTIADCDTPGGVPIGVPVPGTTVIVLNSDDQRCQSGQQGEICIAGQGLATSYLGQPELTAEKFRTIEIDGAPVRIYCTGDIGMSDDNGVLYFRGRLDRQVKISGHRIELAEIELAASSLPGARNCIAFVVSAPDGRSNQLALVYLASISEAHSPGSHEPDPLQVHAHLRKLLPVYMLPSIVRGLSRYPMTANGKVDRAALEGIARRSRPVVSSHAMASR